MSRVFRIRIEEENADDRERLLVRMLRDIEAHQSKIELAARLYAEDTLRAQSLIFQAGKDLLDKREMFWRAVEQDYPDAAGEQYLEGRVTASGILITNDANEAERKAIAKDPQFIIMRELWQVFGLPLDELEMVFLRKKRGYVT